MRCRQIRARLVAYRDDELSPGEATRVREHLAVCGPCARRDALLERATPAPFVRPDLPGEEALWARLDAALARELDRPARVVRPRETLTGWLASEARIPRAAVLVYLVVLLAALGFGVRGWWSARPGATPPVANAPQEIPAGQFLPAAWAPDPPGVMEE